MLSDYRHSSDAFPVTQLHPAPILQEYHKEQVRHARVVMNRLKDRRESSASTPAATSENGKNSG